jgi:hypothetical protein
MYIEYGAISLLACLPCDAGMYIEYGSIQFIHEYHLSLYAFDLFMSITTRPLICEERYGH